MKLAVNWQQIAQFFTELAASFGSRLLSAVVVLLLGLWLIKLLLKFYNRSRLFSKMENGARGFIRSLLRVILYLVLFISIAGIMGVPMTSFVTILASAGLAIGLALQGALSNFAGGLVLLLFHPFRAGDYVDAGGHSGTVKEINVFYTVLTTIDNKVITIPNGSLTNAAVTNYSAMQQRRVDLTFGVSYDTDLKKAQAAILSVVQKQEKALSDPPVFCRLTKHADSALEITLRVWTKAGDYWNLYFDLLEQVKEKFDEEGISIPFPQMDVHCIEHKPES